MKVNYNLIFIIIFSLLSCTQENKIQTSPKSKLDTLNNGAIVDSTTTKSNISWPGDYNGTIPSANIIGMKMKLSLSSFDKYKLEIKTLNDNPKDNKLITYNGNLEWEKDSTTFNLIGVDSISNKFKLNKNEVIYLNPDGTPNSGSLAEFYKLKKVTKYK